MIVRDKTNAFALLFAWKGTILPQILPALLVVVLMSALLGTLSTHHLIHIPIVPTIGFTVFGIILSIFLGFRNNACYDRWWEGRKLWGALIANSRHMIRATHVLPAPSREQALYQVIMFAHLLRDRLRHQSAHPSQFLEYGNVDEQAIELLHAHINPPQYTLEQIQKILILALQNNQISDILYHNIEQHVTDMGAIQAGCDRLASTPLPFSYSVMLHRAVYCFCLILPFSLEAALGIWTPLLVGVLAYMFLGLDALSSQLEEPFGTQENDLPLDSIVRLIEREVLSALDQPPPPVLQAQKHNLL